MSNGTVKTKLQKVINNHLYDFTSQCQFYRQTLENAEYFNYLGSIITNYARCTCEIKSRIAMAKESFSKKKIIFTRKLVLYLRKKLVKCCMWSIALYGAETWTLRKVDRKYLGSFEVVLEKDGEDHLDRSCEKCRSIAKSQGGE